MHRLVHCPQVGIGNGVGHYLGGTGVVLEGELRVSGAGAAAPETEAALVDKGGHLVAVEVVGIGCRVLQVPEHVGGQAGHAFNRDVGDGFMPANFLVDLGAQANRAGYGRCSDIGVGGGAPLHEIRPDDHDFAGAEVLAVGRGFFLGLAAVGTEVGETAQLLRDGYQGRSHGQGVQARYGQDAWLHFQLGLSCQ
ncbi:hypothetical protein D3C79_775600 [compost metagenome]